VSGGLRFIGDGSDFFADQVIQKRRFSGVRSTDQGSVTAAVRFIIHHLKFITRYCLINDK
jgi:hypothetical protein